MAGQNEKGRERTKEEREKENADFPDFGLSSPM